MTQTETLTIRPLTGADHALWSGLTGQLDRQTESPVDPAAFDRLTAASAFDQGAFIALLGDLPVGFAEVSIHRHAHRCQSFWQMQDVQVLAACHGHNIGAQLVRAVYEAALSNGFPAVYWTGARRHLRPRAAVRSFSLPQKVA